MTTHIPSRRRLLLGGIAGIALAGFAGVNAIQAVAIPYDPAFIQAQITNEDCPRLTLDPNATPAGNGLQDGTGPHYGQGLRDGSGPHGTSLTDDETRPGRGSGNQGDGSRPGPHDGSGRGLRDGSGYNGTGECPGDCPGGGMGGGHHRR